MGVDMFDCVMPTRNARNAQLFTLDGTINIRNAKYKNDFSPIDDSVCDMSKKDSKSYLHHLFNTKEILGLRIASSHNLHFYIQLMSNMREKIKNAEPGYFLIPFDNYIGKRKIRYYKNDIFSFFCKL